MPLAQPLQEGEQRREKHGDEGGRLLRELREGHRGEEAEQEADDGLAGLTPHDGLQRREG